MSDLADKVIRANKEEDNNKNQNGPKLDDIGFPLPIPDTEKAWCEYLTARIIYLNKRMYRHHDMLWLGHTPIKETKNSYYRLAKYPGNITDSQCAYVWRRLKELMPVLDTDIIAITPDVTFNMKTGEFKKEKVWTITPWEDEEE